MEPLPIPVPPIPLAPLGVPNQPNVQQPPMLNPAAAAGVQGAAVPPPPDIPCRSYAEFYQDQRKDPYQGSYAGIMTEFAAPLVGNAPFSATNLSNRVYAASVRDCPLAFVVLTQNNAGEVGRVHVFHRLCKYQSIPGIAPSVWDNHAFGIAGDLTAGQVPIIQWEGDTLFARLQGTYAVPTDRALEQLFMGDPDLQLAGPFAIGDPETDEVRSRSATMLPFPFVRLLLAEPLSPRVAFLRIYQAAAISNHLPQCRPLINFLKLACTRSAAAPAVSVIARVAPHLPMPANGALLEFMMNMVHRDLPGLNSAATNSVVQQQQGALQISQGFHELAEEHRLFRLQNEARQAQRDAGRTLEQMLGRHGLNKIMRLCQVDDERLLPPFWQQLAQAPKKQQIHVLQVALDNAGDAAMLRRPSSFVVSPHLLGKVTQLEFGMTDINNLQQGIQPFILGHRTFSEREQIANRVAQYQTVVGAHGVPSLADTVFLTSPDTVQIPFTFEASRSALENFGRLLEVLLGSRHSHPWTMFVYQLTESLQVHSARLHDICSQLPQGSLIPALFLRYVQNLFAPWVDEQQTNQQGERVPINPRFHEDVVKSTAYNQLLWIVPLPVAYVQQAQWSPTSAPRPPGPVPPPWNPISTGSGPGVAFPLPAARTGPPVNPVQARILNSQYDSDSFNSFRSLNIRTGSVKRYCAANNIAYPTRANGTSIRCIAFHVIGQCNSTCGNAADHVHDHTPAEQQTLVDWCASHWRSA